MEPSGITAERVQPPQRGWWSRNWRWAAPSGCLLVILLPLACCIGLFGGTFLTLKNSEPYRTALDQVRTSPKVIQWLGEPIKEATWLPSGSISVENGTGNAVLNFRVAGPKGEAPVLVHARQIGGKWGITTLEVTPPGSIKPVPLEEKAEAELEEAPRWNPGK